MTKLQNIKHEAEKIRLTGAERSAMRAALFGVPSPLVQDKVESYMFMSYHVRMSIAGLLVFVLAGTSTVSAAQGALPGDMLYPVKVSITERVEEAWAPASAKAEVQLKLANRRVEEAQALLAQGRLNEQTAETLTVDFDRHSAKALALSENDDDELEDVEGDESVQTMALSALAPDAEQATTAVKQEKRSVKKFGDRRESLRESLREKAEELKEIKSRSQRQEIRSGRSEGKDGEREDDH